MSIEKNSVVASSAAKNDAASDAAKSNAASGVDDGVGSDAEASEDEEPTFQELEDFVMRINTCLQSLYKNENKKKKFYIETVDKAMHRLFRCVGYPLPTDAEYLMSIECKNSFNARSLLVLKSGVIESVPGKNDPDCYLIVAGSQFVENVMKKSLVMNFKGSTSNGKIRQFIRIMEKLRQNEHNYLENLMEIASTFEN